MLFADFVSQRQENCNLTQRNLAKRSGIGIRFIRERESCRATLRMDKLNMVIDFFVFSLRSCSGKRGEITLHDIMYKVISGGNLCR